MKKTIEKNIKLIISTLAWIILSALLTIILVISDSDEDSIILIIFNMIFSISINFMWWFALNKE